MYQHNKTIRKMVKYDVFIKENINKYNLNCPQIPDHLYRILIIRGSGSKKIHTNYLI